jgi:hypothetical protein
VVSGASGATGGRKRVTEVWVYKSRTVYTLDDELLNGFARPRC